MVYVCILSLVLAIYAGLRRPIRRYRARRAMRRELRLMKR